MNLVATEKLSFGVARFHSRIKNSHSLAVAENCCTITFYIAQFSVKQPLQEKSLLGIVPRNNTFTGIPRDLNTNVFGKNL